MDCTAYQALLSMGFSRQGYWNGLPFPSPGDLPDPGIELGSPALQADALPSELLGKPSAISSVYMLNCVWLFVTPWTVALQAPLGACPWDFLGKNTGMDCHFLLQGIFPTQGLNPVSCIAGRFFTVWATMEACLLLSCLKNYEIFLTLRKVLTTHI